MISMPRYLYSIVLENPKLIAVAIAVCIRRRIRVFIRISLKLTLVRLL